MKVGIIGAGQVGQTLALGFKKDNEVMIGTSNPDKISNWSRENNVDVRSPSETAKFGELLVFCVKGTEIENAVEISGKENFESKIVIDVTNPLKTEKEGEAPKLSVGYPDSNGKKLQEMLPNSMIVKAFNTVPAHYMTNANLKEGFPTLFISGNSQEAKKTVSEIAKGWGWNDVVDLGDIEQASLLESLAMIWITYGFKNNHWMHAFRLLKK